MTVLELGDHLNLMKLTANGENQTISGCYTGDILSLALDKLQENEVWITVQNHETVIAIADLKKAACIILAEGRKLTEKVKLVAEEKKISVFSAQNSVFELTCMVGQEIR